MNKVITRIAQSIVILGAGACQSGDDWSPPTVAGSEAGARVVTVTPAVAGTARVWKGHNFRFETGGVWLLDSDDRASDYCATGVTWRFSVSDNRIWKDLGTGAGLCGPLKQYRKADVMWAP